jgi:hypothetical protein
VSGRDERAARPWVAWLVTLGSLAVLLGLVAAGGGFAEASGARRHANPGQPVTFARWEITVHDARLTDRSLDGYPTDQQVQVRLTMVNRDERSEILPSARLVELILPDGRIPADLDWRRQGRMLNFDPDVGVEAVLKVDVPEAAWPDGAPLTVRLHDEVESPGRVSGRSWTVAADAVDVVLPCDDRRGRP